MNNICCLENYYDRFDPDYYCKVVYIYCWKCKGRDFVFLNTTTIVDCLHCKATGFEPLDAVDKKRERTCNSLYL